MAYAALVSLSQTIHKLLHHHNDQYPISLHEKKKYISIHEYIILLQEFLEGFPEKVNSLEERIRGVANKAEDIIEYFMWKQTLYNCISKSTAGPESVKFSHNQSGLLTWLQAKKSGIQTKLKLHFNFKELKNVAREVMEIKNGTRAKAKQLSGSSIAASLSRLPPTRKDSMVGFDDDLMQIKARLCGESSKLQVIPIFGMGGIGKTTLARNAYDDPLTLEHFQICAWVTVTQDYSAQGILSSLLVCIKVLTNVDLEERKESMEELVYKGLKGRRYLIVMDDLWSTNAWDDVKMVFPDDHNGSRIILTTRLSDVAAYPDSSCPVHEMRYMDADQSWNLLQWKVFPQENCPPELETIGKTIARSCRGLPLAIVVIAGLLSTVSETEASWNNIAKNVNLAINTANDEQFAKILYLSYVHLPHHLRPCFLYMAAFPEDYKVCVSKLIKLWVAEGFLKLSASKSFEEEAEEYLEDLVKRCLVLVIKRKTNGKIKSCGVHDLVRDLCMRKAQEEKFLLHIKDSYVRMVLLRTIKDQRRITIALSGFDCLKNINHSTIHTIICFRHVESSLSSLGNFRLLRVLDLIPAINDVKSLRFFPLRDEVFELFHLRYLAFGNPIEIPAAISKLQNLQTLIIQGADRYHLVCLPWEIWRMPELRHIVSFSFSYLLPYPEGATFALKNLQTFSIVTDFVCSEKMLKMIPNLRKLGISYRHAYAQEYHHLENLVHLHRLEKLKLSIDEDIDFPVWQKLNLAFPIMLKKLTLGGRILYWKDMTVVGSLPNLQVLKLRNNACFGAKWETNEGEFPQLKFLLIEGSRLRHWITESSHFPILKSLTLCFCRNLCEIPDGIGEISTLELIEVDKWNKPLMESAKRIQQEQQSWGNETLQVHCYAPYQVVDQIADDSN